MACINLFCCSLFLHVYVVHLNCIVPTKITMVPSLECTKKLSSLLIRYPFEICVVVAFSPQVSVGSLIPAGLSFPTILCQAGTKSIIQSSKELAYRWTCLRLGCWTLHVWNSHELLPLEEIIFHFKNHIVTQASKNGCSNNLSVSTLRYNHIHVHHGRARPLRKKRDYFSSSVAAFILG